MTTFLRPRLMNTRNALLLVVSHIVVAAAGFAGGIYALPILIAPAAPTAEEIQTATAQAQFTGQFKRDLKDSDSLHWGEGVVSVAPTAISLTGKLAPGNRTTSSISHPSSLKPKLTSTSSRAAWSEWVTSKPSRTLWFRYQPALISQSTRQLSYGAKPLASS